MNDLISIIVPVYNAATQIEKCVSSIVAQTYSNLEIILVNDGSTDNSGIICDHLAEKDSRIRVVHQANKGVAAARNAGLEYVSGDYLSFVDSDDYIEESMIDVLFSLIKQNNADMSICDYSYVTSMGEHISTGLSPITDELLSCNDVLSKMFVADDQRIYWSVLWNKMFRRYLFDEVTFPIGYALEDLYVMPSILSRCRLIACTSKKLYSYVQNEQSILHTSKSWELDSAPVYLHLAVFFSDRAEWADYYAHSISYGLSRFRYIFYFMKSKLKTEKSFTIRKKESIVFFRMAWKNGRKRYPGSWKMFVFFEMYYICFPIAHLICRMIGK